MKIILFRHGPAGARDPSRWPDDAERPLTARGEKRTRLAAMGLRRVEKNIERLITSPLKRADRTARSWPISSVRSTTDSRTNWMLSLTVTPLSELLTKQSPPAPVRLTTIV
jgi:phosphohistidine phosphatase SixA